MDCRRLLGILAVVVGAWLVSLPAVLLAMVAATVFVAILPRFSVYNPSASRRVARNCGCCDQTPPVVVELLL
jgi:hypothetical protein